MKVKLIVTDRLIPYQRNPRKNESAIAKVAASIREFGFRQPIVVDSEYLVIAGHTRLFAAKQLEDEIPKTTDNPITKIADSIAKRNNIYLYYLLTVLLAHGRRLCVEYMMLLHTC